MTPVERPFHEELSRSVWEVMAGRVRSQSIVNNLFQPCRPLLQRGLLL